MQIKHEIKLLIISQIKINWTAVFLGFGSDDRKILQWRSRQVLCHVLEEKDDVLCNLMVQ